MTTALALVLAGTVLVNLPFGYWREGLRKFSPAWFVAVHAPVPLVVGMRWLADMPFDWRVLPAYVGAYFAGQFAGARWRRRVAAVG